MSEAEMADVMGVAKGTVKSRLSRALERLRVVYASDDGDLGAER
jgi:DNA-directed RNA polymerase specialized sigma24 family protein